MNDPHGPDAAARAARSTLPAPPEGVGAQRSHLWPRTVDGRVALILFFGLLLLAEPPLVYALGNRIDPRILAMPFLFVYLLVIYLALIAVLIWAQRRGV